MIKMMILAPRRDGMTHEAFRTYVVQVHGPLVKSVPEVAAEIRRYHYNFPIPGATDAALGHPVAQEFDIFTQAWFDSLQAQLDNMKHPRYLRIIRPDENRFADNERALFHYTAEHEIRPGEIGDRKVFYVRRRQPGLSREAFQARWLERFPAALRGSGLADGIIHRYVQNHVLPEGDHPNGDDPKYFDLIDEFAIAGPDAWAALHDDAGLRARIAAVETELLDTGRTKAYFTETVRNIEPA